MDFRELSEEQEMRAITSALAAIVREAVGLREDCDITAVVSGKPFPTVRLCIETDGVDEDQFRNLNKISNAQPPEFGRPSISVGVQAVRYDYEKCEFVTAEGRLFVEVEVEFNDCHWDDVVGASPTVEDDAPHGKCWCGLPDRLRLAREFEAWADANGVDHSPITLLGYLSMRFEFVEKDRLVDGVWEPVRFPGLRNTRFEELGGDEE